MEQYNPVGLKFVSFTSVLRLGVCRLCSVSCIKVKC